MKKFQFMLPLFAIAAAVTFSAFSLPKPIKATNPLWFYKLTTAAGHGTASNYEPLIDQDEDALCPGESSVRCVIEAPELGSTGTPDLANMNQVISNKP